MAQAQTDQVAPGVTSSVHRATLARTLRGNAWGLADQALLSATNFLTMLVLTRVLDPRPFGAFVLAYTALLLANTIQFALITQPHNVIGATRTGREYAVYTTATAVSQLAFVVPLVVAGGAAAVVAVATGLEFASLFVALVPAAIAWQLQEFVRRVLYTERRMAAAFANDVVSYGGQLAILLVLWRLDDLTAAAALYALAATSAVGALLGAAQLRRAFSRRLDLSTLRENWTFGKWLAGSIIGSSISTHLYAYLVALLVSTAGAGGLKAAQILLGPLNVLLLFLSTVLPIRFARALGSRDTADLGPELRFAYVLTSPFVLVYCAALAVFPGVLLATVYGEKYDAYALVVVLFAVYYVVAYFSHVLAAALTAMKATRSLFKANAASALTTLTLGWLFIERLQVEGAVIGMILAGLVLTGGYWREYRSVSRSGDPTPASEPGPAAAP